MGTDSSSRNQAGPHLIAGVVLLVGLLLGLTALASSARLHLKFCPNANKPGHHCAITVFAGGLAGTSTAPVLIPVVALLVIAASAWAAWVHRAVPMFRLAPSRPPPLGTQPGW